MAKRGVIDHPKFARLKLKLKVGKFGALGILETLWQFTGRFTPRGDIGKYSDLEIEAWLEWDGEEGALIAALITTGWIDEHEKYRLVIHDWSDHIDHTTRTALNRAGTSTVQEEREPRADKNGQTAPFEPTCSDTEQTPREPCSNSARTVCAPPEPTCHSQLGNYDQEEITILSPPAEKIESLGDVADKPPPETKPEPKWLDQATGQVVQRFGELRGLKFDPGSPAAANLRARLSAAKPPDREAVVRDCLRIAEYKAVEWLSDPAMKRHFKLETLYRISHWDTYRLEAAEWDESGRLPILQRPLAKSQSQGPRTQTPDEILAAREQLRADAEARHAGAA